jgi:tetratricopeptide (TPR) repeat protein
MDLHEALDLLETCGPDEAVGVLERVQQEHPRSAPAGAALAGVYEKLERWDDALQAWTRVAALAPFSDRIRRGIQSAIEGAARAEGRGPGPVWMSEGVFAEGEIEVPSTGDTEGTGSAESWAVVGEEEFAVPRVTPRAETVSTLDAQAEFAISDETVSPDPSDTLNDVGRSDADPLRDAQVRDDTGSQDQDAQGREGTPDAPPQPVSGVRSGGDAKGDESAGDETALTGDASAVKPPSPPEVPRGLGGRMVMRLESGTHSARSPEIESRSPQRGRGMEAADTGDAAALQADQDTPESVPVDPGQPVAPSSRPEQDESVPESTQPPGSASPGSGQAEAEELLDDLIQTLQRARIVPDPDPDRFGSPDLRDDIDDMVSETLAQIYASQRKFREAARVYASLARMHPEHAVRYHRFAEDMIQRDRG